VRFSRLDSTVIFHLSRQPKPVAATGAAWSRPPPDGVEVVVVKGVTGWIERKTMVDSPLDRGMRGSIRWR